MCSLLPKTTYHKTHLITFYIYTIPCGYNRFLRKCKLCYHMQKPFLAYRNIFQDKHESSYTYTQPFTRKYPHSHTRTPQNTSTHNIQHTHTHTKIIMVISIQAHNDTLCAICNIYITFVSKNKMFLYGSDSKTNWCFTAGHSCYLSPALHHRGYRMCCELGESVHFFRVQKTGQIVLNSQYLKS